MCHLFRHKYKKFQFMCNVQLVLNNLGQEDISDLKIGSKNLAPGMSIHEFPGIASLPVGSSRTVSIGINFNDTTQPAKFDLVIRVAFKFTKNELNENFLLRSSLDASTQSL